MVGGSLVEHQLLPVWKDSFFLLSISSSPSRCLRFCTFWLEIPLIVVLSIWSSYWGITQSVTCRLSHTWAALARIAVSQTCLCISSSALATSRLWASTLSVIPMVTLSRMDFMVPVSSFNVTWLRASMASLSHPFWSSMLTVNLTSDSTQQCWVASELGVVMLYMSRLLLVQTMNGFQNRYSGN